MKHILRPMRNSDGKTITVDTATYELIKESTLLRFENPNEVWEFARKILESENQVRERAERHAKGDFSLELNNAEGHARDIGDRLDGVPFYTAHDILVKINDCQASSFDCYDARCLQELHGKLAADVHKTDEMVVKLGQAINELRGLSDAAAQGK